MSGHKVGRNLVETYKTQELLAKRIHFALAPLVYFVVDMQAEDYSRDILDSTVVDQISLIQIVHLEMEPYMSADKDNCMELLVVVYSITCWEEAEKSRLTDKLEPENESTFVQQEESS